MSVEMLFSKTAGRHERLLKRQFENPLFGDVKIEPFDIQDARRRDSEEVEHFINEFRDLVQQVTELKPSADVELVLKLKESLDKTYEMSAGLAGDQAEIREMIKRLLGMMMQSMWKAVGNDAMGISKLEMEEQARQAHFALMEYPFIADLLSPDNIINEAMMVPSLLSEKTEVAVLAMQLFEPEQQQLIYQQAVELLKGLDDSHERVINANQRLQDIASVMASANQQPG
ncbi:MAG: hypothetical protein DIZ80_08745 [endosymbiont of Galathealinum brachiosum]|uniref:Uncharacterized protein n=1 Tax=endosymbiont of Galathealinum brachiosum TaxID=2200906 RepID=A0A370DBX2_9GAMM|nr:MAG: hypothetical protein DIZ80_08745 [endosymbiont of Galathealinum brachiosum]